MRYSRRETAPPGERKAFLGLRVARDVDAVPAAAEAAKQSNAAGKATAAKDAKASHPEPAKDAHGK